MTLRYSTGRSSGPDREAGTQEIRLKAVTETGGGGGLDREAGPERLNLVACWKHLVNKHKLCDHGRA